MDKALWARLGETAVSAPQATSGSVNNGGQYTATALELYANELGPVPITTPAYSPESSRLAEGLVHTFKRDYVNVHELRNAESVLAQRAAWIDDCNCLALPLGARHAEPGRLSGDDVTEPRTHAPICQSHPKESSS